jgi:hypothetical protein
LLHQLPFYRKTLENNRKILSGDLSIHWYIYIFISIHFWFI